MSTPATPPADQSPRGLHEILPTLTIQAPEHVLPLEMPPPPPPASEADLLAYQAQVTAWMQAAQQNIDALTVTANSLQDIVVNLVQAYNTHIQAYNALSAAYKDHAHGVSFGMQRLPQLDFEGNVVPGDGLPFMIEDDSSHGTTAPGQSWV